MLGTAGKLLLLREHRANQEAIRTQLRRPLAPNDPVLSYPGGRPLPPNSLTVEFRKLARELGFQRVRFHDLGHTHATILLLQKVNPKVVSERLGHSSVGITLGTYSHIVPGLQEAAALAFEESLKSVSAGVPTASARHSTREGQGRVGIRHLPLKASYEAGREVR
jgi:integrase